jgi:hypothetical protein
MKRLLIIIALIVGAAAIWPIHRLEKPTAPKQKPAMEKTKAETYWTCAMHPQIHMEHPGECPICHMKLISVKARPPTSDQGENRTSVEITPEQLALVGAQRTEVEKMNLNVKIPVSGHFISSSSIAFQIYESDLQYVHRGLSFTGASSFFPDEEISGVISSVDSIVDPTSRTVRVIGSVRKGPRGVLSETGFRGDIELELKDRIAIPESSVLHTGENDLVYIFTKGNELSPKPVKLGLKSEGFYDVLKGVEPGQVISSGPNFLIDSESKIRAASLPQEGEGVPSKPTTPSCPKGQHWDFTMSMCMPGRG